MSVHTYSRLGNVYLDRKIFTIFATKENRYVFLRKEGNHYFYPDIEEWYILHAFTTPNKKVYCKPSSKRVMAFLSAVVIANTLISNLQIFHKAPAFSHVSRAEGKGKIVATVIENRYQRTEFFTPEEVSKAIETNDKIQEIKNVAQTLSDAIYRYDSTLDQTNFARNLMQAIFEKYPSDELNAFSDYYVSGLWYPYDKRLCVPNEYDKEGLYHELMHVAAEYIDEDEAIGFTYPNDPEFEGLGSFMVECGDEYFLSRMGLKKNNSSENVAMIAFSSVMSDEKLIRHYYNGTVKDFCEELNVVLQNMEDAKDIVRMLDLYHEFCMNPSRRNAENNVEMSEEMQLDLFDRVMDYFVTGLYQNYQKDHDVQKVENAIKRMNQYLVNLTLENQPLFGKVDHILQEKVAATLKSILPNGWYEIRRTEEGYSYQAQGRSVKMEDYELVSGKYVNEYGDFIRGFLLVKSEDIYLEEKQVLACSTLQAVDAADMIDISPLIKTVTTKSVPIYVFNDLSALCDKTLLFNINLWNLLQNCMPTLYEQCMQNDIKGIYQTLADASENIKVPILNALEGVALTKEEYKEVLEYVMTKRLEATTNTFPSWYQFGKELSYYCKNEFELQVDLWNRFVSMYEKEKDFTYMKDGFRFMVGVFQYEKFEVVAEETPCLKIHRAFVVDGNLNVTTKTILAENLYYRIIDQNEVGLFEKGNDTFDLLTETQVPYEDGAEMISFQDTMKVPYVMYYYTNFFPTTHESKMVLSILTQANFVSLSTPETIYFDQDGDALSITIKENNYSTQYIRRAARYRVALTDAGKILYFDQTIAKGATLNLLTNRVVMEDPTIYEVYTFPEYVEKYGIEIDENQNILEQKETLGK